MGLLRTVGIFALGAGVMYMSVRGSDPEAADDGLSNMTQSGSNMASAGGYFAGDVLRATGPVVAGAKDAVQSSGIGEMLTPQTIPPASQPDPQP